jgi:hypothetical protein
LPGSTHQHLDSQHRPFLPEILTPWD